MKKSILVLCSAMALFFVSCKEETSQIETPDIQRFEYYTSPDQWIISADETISEHHVDNSIASKISTEDVVFVYEIFGDYQRALPYSANTYASNFIYKDRSLIIFDVCLENFIWTETYGTDYIIYICKPSVLQEINTKNQKEITALLSERYPQDADMLHQVMDDKSVRDCRQATR